MTKEFIHWFPGEGFRPAVWAKDYIGPKIECILPIPAPDADVAYAAKVPPALAPVEPWGHLPNWGTVLLPVEPDAPQVTAASLAGPVDSATPWHPATPPLPWFPGPDLPCCVIREPAPELPPIAPVPLPAAGGMLMAGLVVLMLWRLL